MVQPVLAWRVASRRRSLEWRRPARDAKEQAAMAERIFFLNKLREGVSREEGDRFLLERDIPMGRSIPAITSYVVTKLEGQVFDASGAPYDYLDVLEVTSVADYHAAIAELEKTREWREFVAEWERHVGESVAVYGTVLE
jgi:hypothetical protein